MTEKVLNPLLIDFRIPFHSLALAAATCQILSLVFCLTWSIRFNFQESTATHCRVDNFLPSLSATLDFSPQRDIWRASVGLAGSPRFFIAYLYYKLIYKSQFLLFLHYTEIIALIGLSIVDSNRYFAFHAGCVAVFLFTSIVHMSLVCCNLVNQDDKNLPKPIKTGLSETILFKKKIALVNFVCIIIALYLYDRHNRFCEPGVYSMFSFLEYIVIVANVLYHLQAYYDLKDYSIIVARAPTSELARSDSSEKGHKEI